MLEQLEAGDDDLPPAHDRWKALLKDRNSAVRLAAEKFLYIALHGIPRAQPAHGPELGTAERILMEIARRHEREKQGTAAEAAFPSADTAISPIPSATS